MLEESIHFLRQDYEKQMEQQTIDSQVLQADLDLKKRENAEIAQENSSINIQIQDARNIHSQKETEIQQIRSQIQRSQDDGRYISNNIEECKRQLHMDYQLKESQHQRLFSLQSQLKQGEQSNLMAQSDMNKK